MNTQLKTRNRLINETSPYLLQHAYNPVDWFPWGNEAFEKAKLENKPVFLSIGYSSCHWCHVMEEESFEDEEVAEILNRHFVAIKVDKEERPDIDSVYMNVCQALTGSGGWPLTVIMTGEQKPFFAGTYFPKFSKYGYTGLLEILSVIAQKWQNNQTDLLQSGEQISSAISSISDSYKTNGAPDETLLPNALRQLESSFDENYGGFGVAPKFPTPHHLLFLLRCHHLGLDSNKNALAIVEKTLTGMMQGGIFDHIGYGFSRYSTDEKWLAPHFEKMLYDNAFLVMALVECYQVTGNALYQDCVEKTLLYIKEEMTSPQGGFYSAQDADVDGEEGKFYTFSQDEVMSLLSEAEGKAFCARYDITPAGNFGGRNIPNLIGKPADSMFDSQWEPMRKKLLAYRKQRYALHKDDKILTSWNAMMIVAFAKAYQVLGNEEYLETAKKAMGFLQANLMEKDGGLLISFRDGKPKGNGLLDDYAYLAWASLELYRSTFSVEYLEQALRLTKRIVSDFSSDDGGFYLTPENGEALLFRPKEFYDGAVPCGNSVAAHVLAQLAALTGEGKWADAAEEQLAAITSQLTNLPTAYTLALTALLQITHPTKELFCVIAPAEKQAVVRQLASRYLPQLTVLVKTNEEDSARLEKIAPHASAYAKEEGLFYLCQGKSCAPPVTDLAKLIDTL